MIRVHIKNAQGVETNYADFESMELADTYISYVSANSHWGKVAYDEVVTPAVMDTDGVTVLVPAVTVHHEAEVIFEKEDISSQAAMEDRVEALANSGQSDAKVCAKCRFIVGGYNKEKNLTSEQIQSLISSFSSIDYCLTKNMPKTAKQFISAMGDSAYNTELKAILLYVLADY